MTIRKIYLIFTLLLLCSFVACESEGNFEINTDSFPEIDPTPPAAENIAPVAFITIEPETATPGQIMTLNGKGSYDPDKGILTYEWTQLDETKVTLDANDQPSATFTVPNVNTTLIFQLVVTDHQGLSSNPVQVEIPVTATPEPPPALKFVVVSAENGDDSQSGSPEEPVATIARGIEVAVASGLDTIYVMSGAYDEDVALPGNIKLIGDVTSFDSYGSPAFSTSQGNETLVSSVGINDAENVTVKYIGVTGQLSVAGSKNIRLEGNSFTSECSSSCDKFVAIQFVDSSDIEISGSTIENSAQTGNTFTGIVVQDTTSARIHDNFISVTGAKTSTGVSLRCVDIPIDPVVEKNTISLAGASLESTGVRVNCPQNGGSFGLYKNRITLSPATNQPAKLAGIDASSSKRDIALKAVNNVIAMSVVSDDLANKTIVRLSKLGEASDILLAFNTIYLTGGKGEQHALSSDMDNVSFSLFGNIFMIYGSNASKVNSYLLLKSGCEDNMCAKDIVANLFNSIFINDKLIPLTYYYDTKEFGGDMSDQAEEIETGFFKTGEWTLLPEDQYLVINKGPSLEGVTDDINGSPRDENPDIGAVEYGF